MTKRSTDIRASLAHYLGLSEDSPKEGRSSRSEGYAWPAVRTVLILVPAFVVSQILDLDATLGGILGMLGLVLGFSVVIGVLQRVLSE